MQRLINAQTTIFLNIFFLVQFSNIYNIVNKNNYLKTKIQFNIFISLYYYLFLNPFVSCFFVLCVNIFFICLDQISGIYLVCIYKLHNLFKCMYIKKKK